MFVCIKIQNEAPTTTSGVRRTSKHAERRVSSYMDSSLRWRHRRFLDVVGAPTTTPQIDKSMYDNDIETLLRSSALRRRNPGTKNYGTNPPPYSSGFESRRRHVTRWWPSAVDWRGRRAITRPTVQSGYLMLQDLCRGGRSWLIPRV